MSQRAALLDRIVGVIAGFQSREANLRQQLAEALADDAADDAAIAAAQRDALAAMERAATAEALMAQLQAIGAYIDQFVPALTEHPDGPALPGGDTAAEPAEPVIVAGDSDGADEPEASAIAGDPAPGLGAADPETGSSPDQPTAA
jgi:hypothetical protein